MFKWQWHLAFLDCITIYKVNVPCGLPNHHKMSSSGHRCWLYIIYSTPSDMSGFIRVTSFLRPVTDPKMSMWPNLTNEMWANIWRVIQEKPQEERLPCPPLEVIMSRWNTGNCLSPLVPTPVWEWRWHGMAELTENLALTILNKLSLEPCAFSFSPMWGGRCPYCLSHFDFCFYYLKQDDLNTKTLPGKPRG